MRKKVWLFLCIFPFSFFLFALFLYALYLYSLLSLSVGTFLSVGPFLSVLSFICLLFLFSLSLSLSLCHFITVNKILRPTCLFLPFPPIIRISSKHAGSAPTGSWTRTPLSTLTPGPTNATSAARLSSSNPIWPDTRISSIIPKSSWSGRCRWRWRAIDAAVLSMSTTR